MRIVHPVLCEHVLVYNTCAVLYMVLRVIKYYDYIVYVYVIGVVYVCAVDTSRTLSMSR